MSENIFAHDPFTWWETETPEEKATKISTILEERKTDGYAFYDWINFCDYYGALFLKVCELAVHRKVGEFPVEVLEAANRVIAYSNEVAALEIKIDEALDSSRRDDDDTLTKLLTRIAETNKAAVRVFFEQILPALPYAENYVVPVADREEMINPADYSALGSFMVTMFRNGLIGLQDGHGYPGNLASPEVWSDMLQEIIDNLDSSGKEPLTQKNVETIVDYYLSLWD